MKVLHLRLKGNFVRMTRSSLIQTVFYRWYIQYDTIVGIVGKKSTSKASPAMERLIHKVVLLHKTETREVPTTEPLYIFVKIFL